MWIKVIIKDNQWNDIWNFQAEDNKSFASMAKSNNVQIMTSCGLWACWICKCKVISWNKFIQIDKIWKPRWEILRDSNWNIFTIFTCLAWVKAKYLNDWNDYKIILQRNI